VRISVFSAHGDRHESVNIAEGLQMVRRGAAAEIKTSQGMALQLLHDDRFTASTSRATPAAITIDDVEAAVAGSRRARQKIRWWPITGTPALRHVR
jgi:hypothetical protein